MLSIQSLGADVRKGEGRGWANADKSGQGGGGSILADILQTSFMDDPIQTSAFTICYSGSEYCALVWAHLAYTSLVDSKMNSTMQLIFCTPGATPLPQY